MPKLEWVIDEIGELRHVDSFLEFADTKRPPTVCPVCKEPVSLVLRGKKARHVSHRPGTICSASGYETALHLNCKYHFFREIRSELKRSGHCNLALYRSCSGVYREGYSAKWGFWQSSGGSKNCLGPIEQPWLSAIDDVRLEEALGDRIPDISLFSQGTPIGVIEICVTHAVDSLKERYFLDMGISWIEIRASESLYTGSTAWRSGQPLHPSRKCSSIASGPIRCPSCSKEQVSFGGEAVLGVNVIHLYLPDGRFFQEEYRVLERFKKRRWSWSLIRRRSVWSRRWNDISSGKETTLKTHRGTNRKEAMKILTSAFRSYSRRHSPETIRDPVSGGWISIEDGVDPDNPLRRSEYPTLPKFSLRYKWEPSEKRWILLSSS